MHELRIVDNNMFPTHYINPFEAMEQESRVARHNSVHKHNMTCQKNRKKRKRK